MERSGEVTIQRDGRTYGATFEVQGAMVVVKTHTETRSVQLGGSAPEVLARQVLDEIIDADRRPK